jgi:DNA-binding response OmpR family regulator
LIRFLQLDDDPIFNALCARHFAGRDGIDFIQLTSVNEAERRLRNEPAIDVMMLDLSLPDRDGIEFLTALKGTGFNGKLILMSSQPRNVIDMAAALATAQGMAPALIMDKPITPEKLAEIDEALASRG